jgi:hypothetical protein
MDVFPRRKVRIDGIRLWQNVHASLFLPAGLPYNGDGDPPGAQTERRGGAGSVRSLLVGKGLTGRFLYPVILVVSSCCDASLRPSLDATQCNATE